MVQVAVPALVDRRKSLDHQDFGGAYNSRDADINVDNNELTGGQDIDINPDRSIAKRLGHTLEANFIGSTTGVLGQVVHEPAGGTAEHLLAYDTGIYRKVSTTWTALTSVTLTTNKQIDSAHYPITAKTYIVNQTDNVVKYTSGASGDQTDASFKKGKYIVHFKNRLLVANLSGQADYVWYTDLGVDTFSANNYFRVQGEVTGIEVLHDKVLISTKKKIYLLQNFTFNGVAAGPEAVIPLTTDFGAIYDRTLAKVGNLVCFLGQTPEGIAGVYATDGSSVRLVSDKISPDLNSLASGQLASACAVGWGRFYRIAVAPSGASNNTREYLWNSIANHWLPPYTFSIGRSGGISCYAVIETSGKLDAYAGVQSDGRVYKLNQVDYDEAADQSNIQVPDVDTAVDGNPAKRAAQSFTLSIDSPRTMYVTGVAVMLKKNAGTLTALTARIETNAAGVPSGTLADANLTATITGATGAGSSYVWYTAKFATPAALSADTIYHLVVQHTTEGSGNSQYYMGMKGTASTYSGGIASAYSSSAWANVANTDASFLIFTESDINGYADTKAFFLAPLNQSAHLRELEIIAKATGNWGIQVGLNNGEYTGFDLQDFDLGTNGPTFGGSLVIGQSVLGNQQRVQRNLRWNGKRGKTFKFRFQNRYANQPFTIYAFRTLHELIPKIK